MFAVTLLLISAGVANAQVCKEFNATSANQPVNLDCDMRYRETVVSCDIPTNDRAGNPMPANSVVGTRPSCPKAPMKMIDTPKRSYIADYSPYLFTFPHDATDHTKPYAGAYALGTQGDTSRTFQLFGNTAPGTKRMAACTTQIKVPSDPTSASEDARLVRLQLDNCTNQYILNSALYPFQKENVQLLSLDDPTQPGKRLDLEGECQPLRTTRETSNEYNPSDYLLAAWKKTMQDANYRKTSNVFKGIGCSPDMFSALEGYTLPCEAEPHLPNGTTLENPLAPPSPFPDVPLSTLSAVQYEEIIDPTHPYSPRWDFVINDREYSKTAASWANAPAAAGIYLLMSDYMSDADDDVFCAGVKKADNESDAKKKKDLLVPVDVLEFRRSAFEDGLIRRTVYNDVCYNAPNFWETDDALFFVAPTSYCYNITGFSFWYPWIYARGKTCWECFGLDGQVDDENQHPPCTTNYVGSDLKMKGVFPGGFNLFSRTAQCNYPLTPRDGKYNMDKLCRDIRKPYTQMNRLKMRYHNPDDEDDSEGKNTVLTNGVQEGFTFKEYFDNHMPYPKIWDIGTSLQKTNSTDGNDQPPLDTTGQYTAIVGVGREAASKAAAEQAPADADGKKADELFPDQRCLTSGWGGIMGQPIPLQWVSFGGVSITLPDPMTSWTENKLYQTRTLRNLGMSCIARYEKVFKPGSAENMLLLAAGGEWSRLIVSKCPRTVEGRTGDCTFMSLKEYTDAGGGDSDDTTVYMKQLEKQAWPNSWRGYMAAGDTDNQFPIDGTAYQHLGLDNAQVGDIVMMPYGPKNNILKPGLAKLAMVIEVNLPSTSNCVASNNCYVRVLEPDNGKWPDVCGTTDTWGEMKSRYYYKPGMLPANATAEYTRINYTKNCEETKISQCEMSAWGSLRLYRLREDNRKGCENKDKAADCAKDE